MDALVVRRSNLNRVNLPVSYLTEEDVKRLIQGCRRERDRLLVMLLFQTGLRISEALSLTPASIREFEGKPALEIVGKGKMLRLVAMLVNLKEKLESYAYRDRIAPSERFLG